MAIFTWMVETGVESRVGFRIVPVVVHLMSLFSLRSCHSSFLSIALAILISLPQCSVSSLPFTLHLLNELPRVESPTPKPHSHHLQAHTQYQSSVPRAENLPRICTTLTSSPSASVVLVYSHYTIHNSQYKHASTIRVIRPPT